MSLRDIVAGSDSCTAGAGPSNAMGTFVNNLLGGPSKAHEQLREMPTFRPQNLGMGRGMFAPDAASLALNGGSSLQVPGIGPAHMGIPEAEAIFQGVVGQHAEWDSIFSSQRQGPLAAPPMSITSLPPVPGAAAVEGNIQSFFRNAQNRAPFAAPPVPPEMARQLSMGDKARIRNRTTILSRQMYAEAGDQFADTQVGNLLSSLGIRAADLPTQMPHVHDAHWHDVWAAGQKQALLAPPVSELAMNNTAWNQIWDRPAAAPQLPTTPAVWADEFAASRPTAEVWASEFTQETAVAEQKTAEENNAAATRETTAAMLEAVTRNGDPKMRNSQFVQFLSKMSKGELAFEKNKVVERTPEAAAWASEFDQQRGGSSGWVDEFASGVANMSVGNAAQHDMERAWRESGADALAADEPDWVREFKVVDEDMDFSRLDRMHAAASSEEYIFQADNPFMGDADALEKGKDLFRRGVLTEAALALEAVVRASPTNAEAWRLLGTVHAENEDDTRAIAALERALVHAPTDRDVLLSLGVCYTNENKRMEAMTALRRLLACHPSFTQLEQEAGFAPDSSQRMKHAVYLFERAAEISSRSGSASEGDAEVFVGLGVLRHLESRYTEAVEAFERALQLRPGDYSLWNKMGATLANQGRAVEAISAYQRALDLKPNYMRAWNNMGIAYGITGDPLESAKYYVRALGLNASANQTWSHLEVSAEHLDIHSGHGDLLRAVRERDLVYLQQKLPF